MQCVPAICRLGSVKLETPFQDHSLEAVLLFLCCCYQPIELPQHLDSALAAEGGGAVVQELLHLAHKVHADSLLTRCASHLASKADTLQGSLVAWLVAAEHCHAVELQSAVKQRVVANLRDRASFESAAADFAGGVQDIDQATIIEILAAGYQSEVEFEVSMFLHVHTTVAIELAVCDQLNFTSVELSVYHRL